jgi:hypothetical protein
MLSVQVRFSPGSPLGGVSHRAVFTPVVFNSALREIKCAQQLINTYQVLLVNRIPLDQKNSFLRCSAHFQISLEQMPESLLSGKKTPLLGNLNTARAALSGMSIL